MGSAIEWTDETWNPLTGCAYASEGCLHCYAAREAAGRLSHHPAYEGLTVRRPGEAPAFTGEIRLLADRLDQPLHWRKPRRVFVNSMSDLFHRDVPDWFNFHVWHTMSQASQHTFQVLTKRPKRMAAFYASLADRGPAGAGPSMLDRDNAEAVMAAGRARMHEAMVDQWGTPPDGCARPAYDWQGGPRWWPTVPANVWLGASIELDKYTWRASHLRDIKAAHGATTFLSLEPLLGPLPSLDLGGIDWVIAGGESGPGARPTHPDWIRGIAHQCFAMNVPFFFKQWGEWAPVAPVYGDGDWAELDFDDNTKVIALENTGTVAVTIAEDGAHRGRQPDPTLAPWWMERVGKKTAGRLLGGATYDGYPR